MNAIEVFSQFCNGIFLINDHNRSIVSVKRKFGFLTFLANNQEGRLYKEGTTVVQESTPEVLRQKFYSRWFGGTNFNILGSVSQVKLYSLPCYASDSVIFDFCKRFLGLTVSIVSLKAKKAHATCMLFLRWFLVISVVQIRASIVDNFFRNTNCLGVLYFVVSRKLLSLVYIILSTILLIEGRTEIGR